MWLTTNADWLVSYSFTTRGEVLTAKPEFLDILNFPAQVKIADQNVIEFCRATILGSNADG